LPIHYVPSFMAVRDVGGGVPTHVQSIGYRGLSITLLHKDFDNLCSLLGNEAPSGVVVSRV